MKNLQYINIQGSDPCWAGGASACLTGWRYLHAQRFSEGKQVLQNTLKYKSEQTQFIKKILCGFLGKRADLLWNR